MKLNYLISLMTVGALALLTGCETPDGRPNNTGTGALTGGAIGMASGALLGSGRGGNPAAGALIGGAIGALAGGLIGNSIDEEQREQLRAQAPQTYQRVDQGQPLSVADVKALAAAHISDEVIISQIRNSRTVFRLSSADIIDLHNAGVNEKVIDFMINTPSTQPSAATPPATTYVAQEPPPPRVETVVIAPGPGYVWIGGEWVWRGGWVWMGGHWGYPPYPGAIWVHSTWHRGSRGWSRSGGHWHHH
jgi:outer membrane lipoprotein SlyB